MFISTTRHCQPMLRRSSKLSAVGVADALGSRRRKRSRGALPKRTLVTSPALLALPAFARTVGADLLLGPLRHVADDGCSAHTDNDPGAKVRCCYLQHHHGSPISLTECSKGQRSRCRLSTRSACVIGGSRRCSPRA